MRVLLPFLLSVVLALSGCGDGQDSGLVDEDDPGGADSGIRGGGGERDDPGGDGDDDGGGGGGADGNSTGDGNSTSPGSSDGGSRTWEIVIRDNDFVDGSITIQVGDTVLWRHEDQSTEHTVTADDGSFDSGSDSEDFMNGFTYSEFSHTFDEAGEFPYHCEVHPSMTDTITVEA